MTTSTALAATSASSPVGTLPPEKVSPPPTRLAIFNNPVANQAVAVQRGERVTANVPVPGAPSALTAAIVSLLESATARSTVTVAMYSANSEDAAKLTGDASLVLRALRQAAGRVRAINVLFDGNRGGDQFWKPLVSMPRVTVRRCADACFHPGRAVMHNKFLLVDDTTWTPAREYVVLQLTANLSDGQLSSTHWNSALQIWGDEPLYGAYLGYHRQLSGCAPGCTGAPAPQDFIGSSGSGARLAFFPRARNDDPVLRELQALTGCGSRGGVDVAVNDWWQDLRGLALLKRLEQLAKLGCRVRIVVPEGVDGKRIGALLPRTSLAKTAHCTSFEAAERSRAAASAEEEDFQQRQRSLVPRVHSKYVLMNGIYRGKPSSTVVSTGSERFSGGSRNLADETWLTLAGRPGDRPANAAVYAQYRANFEQMYALTPRCVDDSPGD